jgi:hypothetical protein
MINVCTQCGLYRADKIIDPDGPYAVCPECGCQHPFRFLPLLVVSGASGTGKTSVCFNLTGRYQGAVLLDSDILWRPEFNTPESNYRGFFETWLRVCKNVAQSGRTVSLFGAGVGVPENLENCVERRYFSVIHYLALVCSDEILSKRLEQRPAWRGTRDKGFIDDQIRFNQWLLNYNKDDKLPPISIIETSHQTIDDTAKAVEAWIREHQKR